MGIFSKDNRAVSRLGGEWEKVWNGSTRVADPRRDLTALQAFNKLGDVANRSNATSGDALVIAIFVVVRIDKTDSYPAAVSSLRESFDNGSLRSVRDEPLRSIMSWDAVVEVGELASLMARPVKVEGWRNGVIAAYGRGESDDSALERLLSIAPHSAIDAYKFWRGNLESWRTMPMEERNQMEDFDAAVRWAERVISGFDQLTGAAPADDERKVQDLQEEYASLMAIPLGSHADRITEIREELAALGHEPDDDLVRKVREHGGLPAPPWD